jgi:hypothetical protein
MKKLIMLCLISLTAINMFAQKNTISKPLLFSDFQDNISISASSLEKIFETKTDQLIQIDFEGGFNAEGQLIHYDTKNNSLQTIGIRLKNFHDIMFSLSRRADANNQIAFIGRIISHQFEDGYLLKKINEKEYQLTKIQTEKIMPTCSQQ